MLGRDELKAAAIKALRPLVIQQCVGLTVADRPCKVYAMAGSTFCRHHAPKETPRRASRLIPATEVHMLAEEIAAELEKALAQLQSGGLEP